MKHRQTVMDKAIEQIDQEIKWLQIKRADLLELQASHDAGRATRTTRRATATGSPRELAATAR